MVEDKGETKKLYMKTYYELNRQKMIKQIMAKQKMIKNSDKYIEDSREKIIEELNNGTRKFLQMQTLAKYNININPKTLKYYHDTKHEEITNTLKLEPKQEATREQQPTQEPREPIPYIEAFEKPPQAQPEPEPEEEEEDILTEAIEQEPEKIPTTEAHRMMANMIKEYAKEYIEQMKEEPETPTPTEPPTPTPTQTNESEEWDESMTAETLKEILERGAIHGDEKSKILLYSRRRKNKKKRILIKQIRELFNF